MLMRLLSCWRMGRFRLVRGVGAGGCMEALGKGVEDYRTLDRRGGVVLRDREGGGERLM